MDFRALFPHREGLSGTFPSTLTEIFKEAISNRFLDKTPAELAKTRHYGLGGTIYQGGEESHYFEFKEKKGLIIW